MFKYLNLSKIKSLQTNTPLARFAQILNKIRISWTVLFTWFYFLFFLIIPIGVLLKKASQSWFKDFFAIATQPIALSAYNVTFSIAFMASLVNAVFGFILAWVLVRYNFRGKRLLDAAIDLPFAVPTSVAGLTLTTVYSRQGWIGDLLSKVGIQIVYTKLGIAIAMVFVSLPFVVRAVQPVQRWIKRWKRLLGRLALLHGEHFEK